MTANSLKSPEGLPRSNLHPELLRSHAEMLAADADAKAAKRRGDLEDLRSTQKTPEERVRAWERVHGLTLPRDPGHPILDLIAVKTRLTMLEVQAVQRNDAARRLARNRPAQP